MRASGQRGVGRLFSAWDLVVPRRGLCLFEF